MKQTPPMVVAVLLAVLAGSLEAQEKATTGGWNLVLGLARQGVSDQLASPLRHRGTGFLVGGGRTTVGTRWIRDFQIRYTTAQVSSDLGNARGGFEDTHQVDLGYALLHRVTGLAGGRVGVYLGGALDVRFSVRSHRYDAGEFGSRSESFGDLFAPLQLSGLWSLQVGDAGLLTHRLSVPLLSLVMRSPYSGLKYLPAPALAGPTQATGFDSDLTYRTALNQRWTLGIFHRMTLLKYARPLPLAWVVHWAGLKVELSP